ncbi:MAG: hypothetical protein KF816_08725 [Melioribacteraceae bacterium]|nr:hypothetical protein [Melioribacteraceae bacterium]
MKCATLDVYDLFSFVIDRTIKLHEMKLNADYTDPPTGRAGSTDKHRLISKIVAK